MATTYENNAVWFNRLTRLCSVMSEYVPLLMEFGTEFGPFWWFRDGIWTSFDVLGTEFGPVWCFSDGIWTSFDVSVTEFGPYAMFQERNLHGSILMFQGCHHFWVKILPENLDVSGTEFEAHFCLYFDAFCFSKSKELCSYIWTHCIMSEWI